MIDLKILIVVLLSFGYGCCGQNPEVTASRGQLPDVGDFASSVKTMAGVARQQGAENRTEEEHDNYVKDYCNGHARPIIAFNNTDKRHPDYILGPNETPLKDVYRWYGEPGIAVYVGPDPGANHCGTNNPVYVKEIKEVAKNLEYISVCVGVNPRCGYYGLKLYCDNIGHYIYYIEYLYFPGNSAVCTVVTTGVTTSVGISPEVTTRDFVKDDGGVEQGNLIWIAGVAVGVLVLAGVAIAVGVAYCRLKKNKGQVYQPEESTEGSPPHKSTKT